MSDSLDEIIIEIAIVGTAQRVTAMHPPSLVEVVFQAPLGAGRAAIEQLARQKLAYRLDRLAASSARPPDRGGRLV